MNYIKIKRHGGNSYVQPKEQIMQAIDGELDGLEYEGEITLTFYPVEMTDGEYENLPEFMGH